MDFGSDRRPYTVLGVTPCTIRLHTTVDRGAFGEAASHDSPFQAIQE
jgi:hypothetical protein